SSSRRVRNTAAAGRRRGLPVVGVVRRLAGCPMRCIPSACLVPEQRPDYRVTVYRVNDPLGPDRQDAISGFDWTKSILSHCNVDGATFPLAYSASAFAASARPPG